MKIVINNCYGGYGLSPLTIKRYAEIKGIECYLFKHPLREYNTYVPVSVEEAAKELLVFAYTVPTPQDYKLNEKDEDGLYRGANERAESINITIEDRNDPILIQVIEELGDKANSKFSKLKIVEIPDDVDWNIEEYDGNEWIAEKHRTWS